jgi:hypothetical protein
MKSPLLVLSAALPIWASAAPAFAQETILVQHVVGVTVARAGTALVVTANGTVPVTGFANASLRPRPDLAKVEGGYVLDFIATAPPRDKPQAQVETRLVATFRIEAPAGDSVRIVQVRAALGSRTVQVAAGR